MKNKKGFTLQELLITVGIIGVISAITIPAVVVNLPCENKVNFMKAYNSLSSVVGELASDEALYYGNDTYPLDQTGRPLMDQSVPADSITDATNKYEKFARLLASKMNTRGDFSAGGGAYRFTTTDGTVWTVEQVNGDQPSFVNVLVNVPGENNLVRDFRFVVESDGGVKSGRNFESELLANPSDTKRSTFQTLMEQNKNELQ